jgi:hypothetical protein
MSRLQYEYRRVVRWPSGVQSVTLGTGELAAREDCALALGAAWAQGLTIALERRRVGAWQPVESVVVPPEEDAS